MAHTAPPHCPPDAPGAAVSASPEPHAPSRRPTAVVVDDSATARALVKVALQRAGYDVVAEATDGASAIALYEQHRPDLLTLDIILPFMDGVTAASALLRQHPDAVVVMCSSITNREKIMACRNAGVTHFLLKPIVTEKVTALARSITDARRARTQPISEP